MFRRQHPLGPFVLDFYCPAMKLAVEVDGVIHRMDDHAARDERRDAWLAEQGVQVLRIPADDVLQDVDEVAQGIYRLCVPTPPQSALPTAPP